MTTTLHGIDISHWQSGLQLGNTDAQFVICKATDGTSMVDPECDRFIAQAKTKGIPYGVYHFAERGGTAEADYFVDHITGYLGHALLALDWEAGAVQYGPDAALAFLDRVHERTGVKPVLYTNGSVLGSYDWSAVAAADYGLWKAAWSNSIGSLGPWSSWALWQYTDAHTTGGMSIDGDYFNGTADTWAAYAGGASTNEDDTNNEEDDMSVDDVRTGLFQMMKEAAERSTPTGRSFGDYLLTATRANSAAEAAKQAASTVWAAQVGHDDARRSMATVSVNAEQASQQALAELTALRTALEQALGEGAVDYDRIDAAVRDALAEHTHHVINIDLDDE